MARFRSTLPIPVVLASCALSACGGDEPRRDPPGGIDLLLRGPDLVLDQPGRLVPDEDRQWGEFGLDGWREETEEDPVPLVWSELMTTRLRLPALEARDRTLRLGIRGAQPGPGDGPQRLTIRLNDRVLDERELAPEHVTLAYEVPKPLWYRGDNVLELEVDGLRRDGEGWASLALSSVEYDESVRADVERDAIRLEPRAGVLFRLERCRGAELDLAGSADGDGRLEVVFSYLDAEAGEVDRSGPPLRAFASEGEVSARLPVPDPGGKIIQVEAVWQVDGGGAELTLDRLVLVDGDAPPRVPIVVISSDTLSACNMSSYGYPRETTPNVDRLVSESIFFASCRANAPWTIPSYCSQFTGLYPRAHRLEFTTVEGREGQPWEKEQLAPSRWTLAEALRAGGYRTAAWVDNPWLAAGFGFPQGFEHYDTSAAEIPHWKVEGGIRHILPRVEDWIDDTGVDEPLFLFIQSFDVHAPYRPTSKWKGRFAGDGVLDPEHSVPVGIHHHFTFGAIPHYIAAAASPDGDLPEQMRTEPIANAYDEKILELDDALGDLFEHLKEIGLYDRAILVFSADHGESILSHEFYFDHGTLYSSTLHVPLIVRMPGGEGGGTRVEDTVQLVDLFPTLLELGGLEHDRPYLHGRSLVPYLRGESLEPVPVMSEGGMMRQMAIEVNGWKLIESVPIASHPMTALSHPLLDKERVYAVAPELEGAVMTQGELLAFVKEHPEVRRALQEQLGATVYELYYLPDDPEEANNLVEDNPGLGEMLHELMLAELSKAEDSRGKASFVSSKPALTEEQLQELRDVGYVGD